MKEIIFNDVTLSVIDRGGEQWLTVRDVARALYPYKGYPQSDTPFEKRVLKLYGSSPPHRWLRNMATFIPHDNQSSPPHRWLRNLASQFQYRHLSSPPHRWLRKAKRRQALR